MGRHWREPVPAQEGEGAMASVRTECVDRLRGLRERFQAGGRVRIDEVLLAAGLLEVERFVIYERLSGQTYAEIGQDWGVSRQRVQQLETRAIRKLGVQASLEALLYGSEREENARRMRERSLTTRSADLRSAHNNVGARVRLTHQERALEAMADALLAG